MPPSHPSYLAEARAKRRRTWNDVAEDQASASAAAAAAGFDVAAKRQRGAGGDAGAAGGSGTQRGSSINVQALFSGAEAEVNEVGAATPVNDFRALLDRRDADFTVPGALPCPAHCLCPGLTRALIPLWQPSRK